MEDAWTAMLTAMMTIYRLGVLGDFEFDPFKASAGASVWFFLVTLLFLVVLLNLLIAIMGDIFASVTIRGEAAFLKERAELLLEFERLGMDKGHNSNYLFVSFPRALELDVGRGGMAKRNQWEGEVSQVAGQVRQVE